MRRLHSPHWLRAYLLLIPLFFARTALGEVSVNGRNLTVTTPALSFSMNGMSVSHLANRLIPETYIQRPGPGWISLRKVKEDDVALQASDWQMSSAGNATSTASGGDRQIQTSVSTDPVTGEVVVRLRGTTASPGARGLFWGIQGFDPLAGKFIIPGQAGIEFDRNTEPGLLGLEYPTHWESQFVIYQADGGGVLIYARDPKPYFKRLVITRELSTLDVGFETAAVAPYESATDVPEIEWRIRAFQGDWKAAVNLYTDWSRNIWPAKNEARQPWVRDIQAVITVHNPELPLLQELTARVNPAQTLLYLVNWRTDAFDVNYPNYTPKDESIEFVNRAHELGFRVMLHTSSLGVSRENPAFQAMERFQIRDPETGNPLFWPFGLWPGGAPPPDFLQAFAFISPASPEYRALYVNSIRDMMNRLRPDALHLDAGGVLLNDGNGPVNGMSSIEGMRQLHEDILQAYPGVVLGYESTTEALNSYHSFVQRWPSDYPGHPVGTYLLGRDARFFGFLGQPAPYEPTFIDYIKRYETQGIQPTIVIRTLSDIHDRRRMLDVVFTMMYLWQRFRFEPDWDGDWSGLGFRYKGTEGKSARLFTDPHWVSLWVGEDLIYERVRNSTQKETWGFIKDWNSYDDSTVYGLDPQREYWIDGSSRNAKLRLGPLPPSVSLGVQTLATPFYAHFDLQPVAEKQTDFAQKFSSAKLGVLWYGADYPAENTTAVIQMTRTLMGGQVRTPVLMMQPPYRTLNAAAFTEFTIAIPPADEVPNLHFTVGLSDFAVGSDGAYFSVSIEGQEIYRKLLQYAQFDQQSLDLTAWAGQTVRIRFINHPGPRLDPRSDEAVWADLAITTQRDSSAVPFSVLAPQVLGSYRVSGAAEVAQQDERTLALKAELPSSLTVFADQPPVLGIGASLLDLPGDLWAVGNGGWPEPVGLSLSAAEMPAPSGGVVEARALGTIPPENGKLLATIPVHLAEDSAQLSFKIGLADPSPPLPASVDYTGVGASIRIDGQVVWTATLRTNGWQPYKIDVSPWRGKDVLISLEADAQSASLFDWLFWAGLTLE